MRTYTGDRTLDGIVVKVDGQPLDPAFRIKRLSTLGFEWGYDGAAPAQLALAILADHFGDDTKTLAEYERFMGNVVANFGNEWELTSEDLALALSSQS